VKKTFDVNLLCSALPSLLTVHTTPEIFKVASFYERPRMKKHCCCRRKRRREWGGENVR